MTTLRSVNEHRFNAWLDSVNAQLWERSNYSIDEFPEYDYRSDYENMWSPSSVALILLAGVEE